MRFYLKFINPVMAVMVFVICMWAAIFDGGSSVDFNGLIKGSFSTYFFAKGIFTGLMLFLVGYLLLFLMDGKAKELKVFNKKFYILTAAIAAVLIGLFLFPNKSVFKKVETAVKTETIKQPKEITVKNDYWIKESEKLKIGGVVVNNSDIKWSEVKISCEIYINDKYSELTTPVSIALDKNQEEKFIIKSDDLYNELIRGTVKFKFLIEGVK